MPILDMPNVPPLDTPVIIASAAQAQRGAARTPGTVRVCRALSNPPPAYMVATQNTVTPASDVASYFYSTEKRTLSGPSTVTVLEKPLHGTLQDVGTVVFNETMHSVRDTGLESYNYTPDNGYIGVDRVTMLVSIGDFKVKTEYVFQVAASMNNDTSKLLCPKPFSRVSAVSVPSLGFGAAPGVAAAGWRTPPQG